MDTVDLSQTSSNGATAPPTECNDGSSELNDNADMELKDKNVFALYVQHKGGQDRLQSDDYAKYTGKNEINKKSFKSGPRSIL